MHFDKAFIELLGHEGGYSNNPSDPGGETNWGITRLVARNYGYKDVMVDLPKSIAKAIYRNLYWEAEFDVLSYPLAFNIFDASVNHGKSRAIKFLQAAVSVRTDGYMGPKTLAATLDSVDVISLFNSERLTFYTSLKTFNSFGRGWTRRVAHNLRIK